MTKQILRLFFPSIPKDLKKNTARQNNGSLILGSKYSLVSLSSENGHEI